jgi:hypothetical protein
LSITSQSEGTLASEQFSRVLKNSASRLFKKGQMPGAREIDPSASLRTLEAYLPIRCSDVIERNEAGGPFSTACQS